MVAHLTPDQEVASSILAVFKGRLQPSTASSIFISLLVLQPLEYFFYVSSIAILQLRMVDLCFNRQASGARKRNLLTPAPC